MNLFHWCELDRSVRGMGENQTFCFPCRQTGIWPPESAWFPLNSQCKQPTYDFLSQVCLFPFSTPHPPTYAHTEIRVMTFSPSSSLPADLPSPPDCRPTAEPLLVWTRLHFTFIWTADQTRGGAAEDRGWTRANSSFSYQMTPLNIKPRRPPPPAFDVRSCNGAVGAT